MLGRQYQLNAFTSGKTFSSPDRTLDLPVINPDDFTEHTFDNLKDHFDFQNNETYKQRYWVNDVYWTADTSGPNFLYINGEGRAGPPSTSMYPFMVGASHNARLWSLEHRFYGDS